MDDPFPRALGVQDARSPLLPAWRRRLALTLASFTLVHGGTRACGVAEAGGQQRQPRLACPAAGMAARPELARHY
jgi:hypothetical protein